MVISKTKIHLQTNVLYTYIMNSICKELLCSYSNTGSLTGTALVASYDKHQPLLSSYSKPGSSRGLL